MRIIRPTLNMINLLCGLAVLLLWVLILRDNAAGQPLPRFAGRIGSQVIFVGMNHDGLADDGLRATQLNNPVNPVVGGCAVIPGLDIAEIAHMALSWRIVWTTVGAAVGIEVAASGSGIRGAAIPEFMNVEAMARLL
jgi:hypothetical protein